MHSSNTATHNGDLPSAEMMVQMNAAATRNPTTVSMMVPFPLLSEAD
jgi:hypothetical protein